MSKSFTPGRRFPPAAEWLTTGGRVLGITATDSVLAEALNRCYRAIEGIHWKACNTGEISVDS